MPKMRYTALTDRPLLIGIMLENKYLLDLNRRRVEELEKNFETTVFLFSPRNIDYQTSLINGVYFNRQLGRWENKNFRFPDVLYLYSGLPKFRDTDLPLFQQAVTKYRVRIVNKLLELNKWEVYRALKNDSQLKAHLPETRLYQEQRNDLEAMLRKYGGVYLKACRGRRGQQVMQVTSLPGGFYNYRYFVDKLTSRKVQIKELFKVIHHFFRGRDFVIQQPIDLIDYNGQKIDLRAEVQRNGRGQLEIVAVPVRVARENSPITTHGSSYRFEEFFTNRMHYSEAEMGDLKNRLADLLFRLYRGIEKYTGPSGEFGIDIGLDKQNRLWFIECNPLSARVSLINAYDDKTVRRAFTNPLEYALYRSGGRFS